VRSNSGASPKEVDWPGLSADLTELMAKCECAPILVRLAWHDSGTFSKTDGTGGSRGAQRFPTGESAHGANAGLSVARGLLQPFKEKHPAVSYADLWALAAVVAISASGGPSIPFSAGRLDIASASECVAAGRLPDGDKGATHVRSIFYRMGFNDTDIVALSGAHTLGRCHADRSGFEGPWTTSPLRFDNSYFKLLLACDWKPSKAARSGQPQMSCASHPEIMMLTTDHTLATDAGFRPIAQRFESDATAFHAAFASAPHSRHAHTRICAHAAAITPRLRDVGCASHSVPQALSAG
jgi:cytochrome c peroxidase